jgi:hypothetical protein
MIANACRARPEATPRGWRARAQITNSDSVKTAPLATRFADHIGGSVCAAPDEG